MVVNEMSRERYFQCPYCVPHEGGHKKRVPRSIGKYRIRIIYENVLILTCGRCAGVFKLEFNPNMWLWEHMKEDKRLEFKHIQHKKYKGGRKKNGN